MQDERTINDITRDVLKIFGYDLIKELIKELAKRNKNASGKLSDSFNYQLRDFINSILLEFTALDYEKFIESGRRAGTFPPTKAIKDWCVVRGLDEKSAYPIAQKIFKLGIKPTPYVDDLLNTSHAIENLIPTIEKNYEPEIEIFVNKLITETK